MMDPYKLDYLVSQSQFAEYFRESNRRSNHRGRQQELTDDELERRFEVYKENFVRKQTEKFFQKHKNSEWYALLYFV